MKTAEESYIEYICPHCKNKDMNLCEIRRRYDNTIYCKNYDTNIVKRKKTPIMWQGW